MASMTPTVPGSGRTRSSVSWRTSRTEVDERLPTSRRLRQVTNLVEERENDFTAELFVAPISRYSVLLGKVIGAGIASLISLVGIIAMIFVMQIPMDFGDLLRVIALSPVLALAGGVTIVDSKVEIHVNEGVTS